MSAISVPVKELECPICTQIPFGKIYQCKNGHLICASCSPKLTTCPQCRCDLKYNGELIRNRAWESLVEKLVIPCPFNRDGCNFIGHLAEMDEHKNKCKYKGHSGRLCRHLGFNCDFSSCKTNLKERLDHFVQIHQAVLTTKCYREQDVEYPEIVNSVYPPVIIPFSDNCRVLIAGSNETGFMRFKCIQIDDPNGVAYQATFAFGSVDFEANPFRYTVPLMSLADLGGSRGSLFVKFEELEDLYVYDADVLQRVLMIRVLVKSTTSV